ncbi:hypothetical protein AYX13_01134 [Cryptococcus neoformans]|nr:hypothetical protein AYX13_01134 [Cryptococcus neoformans var. grubii]
MATSLFVPVAYITVLVTAMAIFSRVYRRRRAVSKTSIEPWFSNHPTREVYMSLLADEPPAPENLLKAALLSRAITDVQRIWRLKDDKTALASLHTRGLVGDDTMTRFAAAEKELEAEIVDVISEANTFKQGWGQFLFATATEMAQAEKTKEAVINMHKTRIAEEKRLARRAKYLLQKPQTQPSGPESQVQKVVAATGAAQSPAKVPLSQKEASGSISQLTEGVRKESAEPKANMPVPSAVTPNSKGGGGKKKGKKK